MPDPSTPTTTSMTVIKVDTWWIALAMVIVALVMADASCLNIDVDRSCETWADGGPLDPVSAAERRDRVAYCDAEADAGLRENLRKLGLDVGEVSE